MFLRPTGSQWRTPEMGKAYIVNSWRGITRVQIWPKARGPAKTLDEQNRQLIFRLYQQLIKRMIFRETENEREGIIQHNRTHRGQRGSAAIRLRDWQTQRLYGRGVAVTTSMNVVFYPPAIKRDASNIMDHVTAEHGQLCQRQLDRWTDSALPSAEYVLTAGPTGQPNTWTLIPG